MNLRIALFTEISYNAHMPADTENEQRTVALPADPDSRNSDEFRLGIFSWASEHRRWRFITEEIRRSEQDPGFDDPTISGAIVPCNNERLIARLSTRGLPILLVDPFPEDFPTDPLLKRLSAVRLDSRAVGVRAAEYFLLRKYRHFAYVAETTGCSWSHERRDGFVERLRAEGFDCAVYDGFTKREKKDWLNERPRMVRWLSGLPKPTAILAAMDGRARFVLDACRAANLSVPEEIAVLGVDNNELICKSCSPTLSSIPIGSFERGRLAAETLDKLMTRRHSKAICLCTPPSEVVTRDSTGYDAMQNPVISRGLRFIREQAPYRPISVTDVVKAMNCSRRHAEVIFSKGVGQTIREQIVGASLDRVKSLLANTDLSTQEIADRCGYAYYNTLATLFRRTTGVPMNAWRMARRRMSF